MGPAEVPVSFPKIIVRPNAQSQLRLSGLSSDFFFRIMGYQFPPFNKGIKSIRLIERSKIICGRIEPTLKSMSLDRIRILGLTIKISHPARGATDLKLLTIILLNTNGIVDVAILKIITTTVIVSIISPGINRKRTKHCDFELVIFIYKIIRYQSKTIKLKQTQTIVFRVLAQIGSRHASIGNNTVATRLSVMRVRTSIPWTEYFFAVRPPKNQSGTVRCKPSAATIPGGETIPILHQRCRICAGTCLQERRGSGNSYHQSDARRF
ncbi:hypothetical protein PS870_01240 [Pseudomonas fluorescens]|uniref:Uncharacterized protein n=1 Tax=Pseudomonas fluorescens TaxID=294 RepID=A0A5E7I376_PSEFL|nr:hypothetical protein PS870_01240 [Pseudomonas fluorescens]